MRQKRRNAGATAITPIEDEIAHLRGLDLRDFARDGTACFSDHRLLIWAGIYCSRSSPIGFRPIASAISITRLGSCSIERK